jgi:hypothetical protein
LQAVFSEDPSVTVAVLEAGMNVEDLPEVVVDTIHESIILIENPGVYSGSDWNRKGQLSKLGL